MQKSLKILWSNNFLKGGVFYTASSFLGNIMNYLFNLIAGRSLGPPGYGELTALFSYLAVATVPLVVLSNFIIQKIAGAKNRAILAKSVENLFWEKVKRWSFFLVLLFFLPPILAKLTNLSFFLSFSLILFLLLSIISSIYGSLLQGLQLFFIYALMGVVATFIKLLGAITVLFGLDGIFIIIIFIFLSSMIGIFWSFKVFRNQINLSSIKIENFPRIEKRLIQLFKNSQFQLIFVSTLALTILNNADVVFVKKYFSAVEAGIYSSWSIFAKIILYALGPFIAISFIFFSSGQRQKTERKTLHFSLAALFLVGVVNFLTYKYLTSFIIDIFFGKKFYGVSPFLTRASIFGTFYTGIAFINNFFLAKKSRASLILFLALFFYIILLFLINRDLLSIMNLNVSFSIFIFIIYLVLYFKMKKL